MNKQPACLQHPPRDADAQQAGTDAPDNSHLASVDYPTSEYAWSAWQNWGPKPRSSSLAGELLPRAGDKISWSRARGTVQRVSAAQSGSGKCYTPPGISLVLVWFGQLMSGENRSAKFRKHSGWVGFTCLNHAKSLLRWCRQTLSKLEQSWAGKGGSLDNTPLTPDV